jgi:BirA family biotin operon repressor/biotin-[acetyl-CoA-carboxylase] ligase
MKLAIHHFESVVSTNDLCKHYINEGAGEGAVILADMQTSGKGRHGRVWASPVGNLYTSILLTPSVHDNPPPVKAYAQLAFMTGLGVLKGLETLGATGVQLKWPNDGLVNNQKLFGILVECVDDAVVVGIGINVNHAPEGVGQETTSLATLLDKELDVADVFHAVLKSFWQVYRQWIADGFDAIRTECLSHTRGLNSEMTLGGKTGHFTGISDDGALLLTATDGTVHAIVTV